MNVWPLVYDGVALLLLFFILLGSYKKGFVHELVSVLGSLASYLIAIPLSSFLAKIIYNAFAQTSMEGFVRDKVASFLTGGITYETLPQAFKTLLISMGMQPADIQGLLNGSEEAISNFTNVIAEPLAISILTMILFLVAFFLCNILVKLIAGATNVVNYIPLVGGFNRILGLLMGILKWGIFVMLLAIALQLVITLTGDQLTYLNTAILQDSYVFKTAIQLIPIS